MKNILNLELVDFVTIALVKVVVILKQVLIFEALNVLFVIHSLLISNLDPDCRSAILENGGIQEILNCLSRYNFVDTTQAYKHMVQDNCLRRLAIYLLKRPH